MIRGGEIRPGSHPELHVLALYASGDLKVFEAWRTERHVRCCGSCEQEVRAFRSTKAELRRATERCTLAAFETPADWNRLEREMAGNIAVGVAAARCIERTGRKHMLLSRGVVIGIGLAALFAAGWMTHIPMEQNHHLVASIERIFRGPEPVRPMGTIVETTPEGIAVHTQAASLTILHPPSAVVSLAGGSGVTASYIDDETGEVTVTTVYGQ
jgi:hypothetical protein